MVQIFYNMEGLSHKLKSVGIFKNPNEMAPFARAFSLNKSLFSFIDVGSGKERADHKVRGKLANSFSYGYAHLADWFYRDTKAVLAQHAV